jgi:hypothetical protein
MKDGGKQKTTMRTTPNNLGTVEKSSKFLMLIFRELF